MALGPSNSLVESAFSQLNAMLSDRRLSLQHSTMENLLLLKHNAQFLTAVEIETLISSSVSTFLQKRRKRKLPEDEAAPAVSPKRACQDIQHDPVCEEFYPISDNEEESDFDSDIENDPFNCMPVSF